MILYAVGYTDVLGTGNHLIELRAVSKIVDSANSGADRVLSAKGLLDRKTVLTVWLGAG